MNNESKRDRQGEKRLSPQRRLTYRLLIKTISIFGTVTLLLLLGSVFLFEKDFSSHTQARMAHEANRMKSILEWIMLDSADLKRERAESYLTGLAKDTFITQLRVFSVDTTVVFSGDETEVGQQWELKSAALCRDCHKSPDTLAAKNRTYSDTTGKRFYHFVLPIENRPACMKCHEEDTELRAIMVVDFSLEAADSSAAEARLEAFGLLGILLLAFVTLIYALLNRAVYRPLVVIAGRLNRIASGDFSGYERGARSGSSNIIGYIHDQIDTAGEHLNTSYLKLESQVEARTLSLWESQEALGQERNRLRLLLDSSHQGILEVSVEGHIIFANARIAEMTGVTEEQLVGSSMSQFPILAEIFEGKALRRARASEELHKIEHGAEQVSAEDLGDQYFNVHASRVEATDGNTALLIMLVDTTLERKVEQNLRRQERLSAIGGLAAGVAHEVGNPLSAISSVAQMMKHDTSGERDQTNLDLIAYHIDRINRIVRGLSDLSRDPHKDQVTTTLSSVIEAAVEIAGYDERARTAQFSTSYPDQERQQTIARDSLMQALINILMNALDAIEHAADPKITITLTQDSECSKIAITDNGHGIPAKVSRRLFEPFFTTKPEGKGTGLGLFITHKIISKMNGTLDVESAEGKGATFTISLSLEPEKSAADLSQKKPDGEGPENTAHE